MNNFEFPKNSCVELSDEDWKIFCDQVNANLKKEKQSKNFIFKFFDNLKSKIIDKDSHWSRYDF